MGFLETRLNNYYDALQWENQQDNCQNVIIESFFWKGFNRNTVIVGELKKDPGFNSQVKPIFYCPETCMFRESGATKLPLAMSVREDSVCVL